MMAAEYLCKTLDMVMGPMGLSGLQDLLDRGVLAPGDEFCQVGHPWQDVAVLFETAALRTPRNPLSPEHAQDREGSFTDTAQHSGSQASHGTRTNAPQVPGGASLHPSEIPQPQGGASLLHQIRLSNHLSPSVAEDTSSPQGLPAVAPLPNSPSSREMRLLVAECVSRQRSSQSPEMLVPAQQTRTRSLTHAVSDLGASLLSAGMFPFVLLGKMTGWLLQSRLAWGVVGALAILWMIPKASLSLMTREQAYAQLEHTFTEWKDLQASETDPEAWEEFQQRSLSDLEKIWPKLERDARIHDPTSMSLLWIARDYLPAVLGESQRPSTETQEKIETHLASVKTAFLRESPSKPVWDRWIVIIVAIDVLLVLAGLAWGGKTWVSRRRPVSLVE